MMHLTAAALIAVLTVSSKTTLAADRNGETVTRPVAVDNTSASPAADIVNTSGSERDSVATRGPVLPILYASYAALQAYDSYSTIAAVKHGARESNALMSGLAGKPAAFCVIKGGVTTVSIVVAERLWRQHRRAEAIATMVISNGIMAAVAARNTRVLRAQQ